jgi:uncharacterized protein YecT (DUF1311 family)
MKQLLAVALALSIGLASWDTDAAAPRRGEDSIDSIARRVCDKKPDEWGRSGCFDRIVQLDTMLNGAFRGALPVTQDVRLLKREQRRWLTEVRDACESAECMEKALLDRIEQLHLLQIHGLARYSQAMTDEDATRVCQTIADSVTQGTLQEFEAPSGRSHNSSQFALPVRADGPVRFEHENVGGTCWGSRIRRLDPPDLLPGEQWPTDEIEENEEDEWIRWSTWGAGERVLLIDGRYFAATSGAATTLKTAGLVTWLTPAGTRRPLCWIGSKETRRLVVLDNEPRACRVIATRKAKPVTWRALDIPASVQRRDGPWFLDQVEEASIDLNNDGVTETVYRTHTSTGRGCGGSEMAITAMHPGLDNESEPKPEVAHWYSKLIATNTSLDVFLIDRQTYVLKPQHPHFIELVRPTDNGLDRVCSFEDRPVANIMRMYRLDGIVRDPTWPQSATGDPVRR